MHHIAAFIRIMFLCSVAGCADGRTDRVGYPIMLVDGGAEQTDAESRPRMAPTTPADAGVATADPCGASSPEAVRDGDFEHHPVTDCGWVAFDGADWGLIATPYCVAADHPNCSMYLEAKVWGDDWLSQFYQRLALVPGRDYTLSFEAKAAGGPRRLIVAVLNGGPLLQDHDDAPDLGAGLLIGLTTDWQSYAFSFTATEHAARSILVFAFGGAEPALHLDNVSIVPVAPPEADAG